MEHWIVGGSGKWTVKNNDVILNSRPKAALDFTLLRSTAINNDFTMVKIIDNNKNILRYIYAFIKFSDTTIEEKTNEEGELKIHAKGAESISLVFEFSPEKISRFNVNKENNYYEFKLEPFITEVFFENFHLEIGTNELKGKHPLLEEKEYSYEKEK